MMFFMWWAQIVYVFIQFCELKLIYGFIHENIIYKG